MNTNPWKAALLALAATVAPAASALAQSGAAPGSAPVDDQKGRNGAPADPVLLIQVLEPKEVFRGAGDNLRVNRLAWARGIRYPISRAWGVEKPSNPMRIAQYVLPERKDSGAGDGLLTVTGGIGGSVEDNVARWVAQFKDIEGAPTQQDLFLQDDGIVVTQVIVTGSYNAATPGAPADYWPGQTLYGAIVQNGPEGVVFFKAVGPTETMEHHRLDWDILMRNFRVVAKPSVTPRRDRQDGAEE